MPNHNIINNFGEYFKSDYFQKANAYHPDHIQFIYKGDILEQFHIEADIYTEDDFKADNNMSIVIVETEHIGYNFDNDDYDDYDELLDD